MARLVTSGAEFKAATTVVGQAESEGYICSAADGAPTIETTVVRSGAAAWKATGKGQWSGFNQTTVDANNYFARGYFRLPATPSAETILISVQPSATGSVRMLAGTTTVALFDNNDAQVGSASGSLALDTWHRIELVIGKTATRLELYVDGVQIATTSSAALAGTFTQFRFGHCGAAASTDVVYWDDIALNDSTGGVDDGLPGPGKIILRLAASDYQRDAGWVTVGGGATDLWDALNNTPPTGNAAPAATDQIRNAVSTTTETYTAETGSYSAGGIVATDRVKIVRAVAVVGDNVGAATRSIGLQLTANPSDTEVTANTHTGAVGNYPSGWVTIRGTLNSSPSVTLGDPIRVRVRKNDTNADLLDVALLGVYVEYTEMLTLDLSDSITVSESLSGQPDVALSDSATLSDTSAREPQVGLSDSLALADTQAKEVQQALSDAVAATDALQVEDNLVIGDSLTVTDEATTEWTAERTQADSAALSDALAIEAQVALSDEVTLSDDLASQLTEALTLDLADSVALTDDLTAEVTATTMQRGAGRFVIPWGEDHALVLHDHVGVQDAVRVELDDSGTRREEEELLALVALVV